MRIRPVPILACAPGARVRHAPAFSAPLACVFALVFALGLGLAAPQPAAARTVGDVYVVADVPVDASGTSATEAREIALAEGRVAAAQILLRRLTVRADWPRLPALDAAAAEAMVAGLGIANERSSATRYLADLTVRFRPGPVRAFLRNAGVRFTDNQAAPALLLPVLDTPGMRVLFDEPNPWRAAWNSLDLANTLVPLIMPLGDLEDISAITGAQALSAAQSGDWQAVAGLAARYGTEQVLVAHAVWQDGAGLDVTLTRLTPAGRDATTRRFEAASLEEAVATAAADLQAALIAAWKAENAVAFGLEQTLPVSVEFASLAEWQRIRKALGETSIVQQVDIVAVSPRGAQVALRVAGPVETVAASLAQRRLRLEEADGYWMLALGTAPVTAPLLETPALAEEPADEALADRLMRGQPAYPQAAPAGAGARDAEPVSQ